MKTKIIVVLPAKNEGAAIGSVIDDCFQMARKFGEAKVLVVSDSRDNTDDVAKKHKAVVVRGPGTGLGAAMYRGLKAAAAMGPDIIVSMDADGQSDVNEMPNFIKPILSGEADFVVGSRFLKPGLIKYKMEFSHLVGNKLLAWMIRRISKRKITDSHGGLRAMRREVAESLEMIGTHSYVQETIIDAAQKNFRIKEIPSVWLKRDEGKSKVVASITKYATWQLPTLLLRAGLHMRVFTAAGFMLTVFSILFGFATIVDALYKLVGGFYTTPTAYIAAHVPRLILFSTGLVSGLVLFFFGYMIDLLIRIKTSLDRAAYEGKRISG